MTSGLKNTVTSSALRERRVASGQWDDRTLWRVFRDRAGALPTETAVIDGPPSRAHTCEALFDDVCALSAILADAGLGRGDIATVQLPNRYESVVVVLALYRRGVVLNPVLPNYRANELRHIFQKASPKAVFSPAVYRGFDHRPMIEELLPAGARHVVVDDSSLEAWRAADLEPVDDVDVDAAAVSQLVFSSGTEATPKGVMHTEQTTNAGVRSVYQTLGMTHDDVVWMPSPIGHSTGFNFGLRLALFHGLPLVLQDRWDASDAVALVETHGATYTLAATTFLQDLVAELGARGHRLASLDKFMCGGAPVPPELVDAAGEVGVGVQRLYGSTEALVATFNRPGMSLDLRRHTDGAPCADVEVRIVDEEIQVRSPQCAVGYFEDEERQRATFLEDGWVHSGDIGVLDGHGHVRVVGRKKEIIIRGGLNIAPREIEDLILGFDEVERCAVIGVPDDRLGERMCACVTLRRGAVLDLDTVVHRLQALGLATYKLPERLHVVDALPTTASGKIQKHVLRAHIQKAHQLHSSRAGFGRLEP
jgi:acyl-CoA synthetase (AMP-forming)/AMP-acid ligase II